MSARCTGLLQVFLRYWHVQRLHALMAEYLHKVVVCQSVVRGYHVRKRLGGSLTPEEQTSRIQQFCDHVALLGGEAWRTTRDQADIDGAMAELNVRVCLCCHYKTLHLDK